VRLAPELVDNAERLAAKALPLLGCREIPGGGEKDEHWKDKHSEWQLKTCATSHADCGLFL